MHVPYLPQAGLAKIIYFWFKALGSNLNVIHTSAQRAIYSASASVNTRGANISKCDTMRWPDNRYHRAARARAWCPCGMRREFRVPQDQQRPPPQQRISQLSRTGTCPRTRSVARTAPPLAAPGAQPCSRTRSSGTCVGRSAVRNHGHHEHHDKSLYERRHAHTHKDARTHARTRARARTQQRVGRSL